MRTFVTLAAAASLCLTAPLAAQEEAPKAEKHENVTWYAVTQIDFKPGKADAAKKIIREHYVPASEQAGTPGPVMALEHQTGEWDMTVIWHMKRGPGELEWKNTPEGAKWQAKFVEMAGGPEKAREIGEAFSSYIAREHVTIAMQSPDIVGQEAMGGGD